MSNYPPGVSDKDVSGPQCPQCGEYGCDCEDDGDQRSWRERIEEEKGEMKADAERDES